MKKNLFILSFCAFGMISFPFVSAYTQEQQEGYQWAYSNRLTSQSTIDAANLNGNITRQAAAKMIVNYLKNVKGNYSYGLKLCSFPDENKITPDLQIYAKKACAYGIMGKNYENFNPTSEITRAQLGTIISRIIRGNKYDNPNGVYYIRHLIALKENGIMTTISNPTTTYAKRGELIIILKRTYEKMYEIRANEEKAYINSGVSSILSFLKENKKSGETSSIKGNSKTYTFESALKEFEKENSKGSALENVDKLKGSFSFSTDVDYSDFGKVAFDINADGQIDLEKLIGEVSSKINADINIDNENSSMLGEFESRFVNDKVYNLVKNLEIGGNKENNQEYKEIAKLLKNQRVYYDMTDNYELSKESVDKFKESYQRSKEKKVNLTDLLFNEGNIVYNGKFSEYKGLNGWKFSLNKKNLLKLIDINSISSDSISRSTINRYLMRINVINSLKGYILISGDDIVVVIDNIDIYSSSYNYNYNYNYDYNYSLEFYKDGYVSFYFTNGGIINGFASNEDSSFQLFVVSKEKGNIITTTISNSDKEDLLVITNDKNQNSITIANENYFSVRIKTSDKSNKQKIDYSFDINIRIFKNVLGGDEDLVIPFKGSFTLEEAKSVNVKTPSGAISSEKMNEKINEKLYLEDSSYLLTGEINEQTPAKSRDVARQISLTQIATAIITSQQDRGYFPGMTSNISKAIGKESNKNISASDGLNISEISDDLLKAGMSSIPTDPDNSNKIEGIGNLGNEGEYRYIVSKKYGVKNAGFLLMAKTETESGSNWLVCNNGEKNEENGYISNSTDLANIKPCSNISKGNSCSLEKCTYSDENQLRYIYLY